MLKFEDSDVERMYQTYRMVRKLVYEEATRPSDHSLSLHGSNKELFSTRVRALCADSNIEKFLKMDRDAAILYVWHHLWSKIRYAGFKAATASAEIEDIKDIFDDVDGFSNPDWDIYPESGRYVSASRSGQMIQHYYQNTGPFEGRLTVKKAEKIRKTVRVARSFCSFINESKDRHPIEFLTAGKDISDVWGVQDCLNAHGYTGELTQLHVMMDLGFTVIKPDIVINRLFLDWGWLNIANAKIPFDLSHDDLEGKGKYGQQYQYTKKDNYRRLIDLAIAISRRVNPSELQEDIGWVTENPLREIDIFIVKFGQKPDRFWGLTKRLADTVEIVPGVKWKSLPPT